MTDWTHALEIRWRNCSLMLYVESQEISSHSAHRVGVAYFFLIQEKVCPDSGIWLKMQSYAFSHLVIILTLVWSWTPYFFSIPTSTPSQIPPDRCSLSSSQIHLLFSTFSASVSGHFHFLPGLLKHLPIWFFCFPQSHSLHCSEQISEV